MKIKRKGFTLAELLVVVIIMAILAAIALPLYTKIMRRSRASDALKNLALVTGKQEAYFVEHGAYATNFTQLRAPIKGLTGAGAVAIAGFEYVLEGGCIQAKRNVPKEHAETFTIFQNYRNNQAGCYGAGCKYIKDLIPKHLITEKPEIMVSTCAISATNPNEL